MNLAFDFARVFCESCGMLGNCQFQEKVGSLLYKKIAAPPLGNSVKFECAELEQNKWPGCNVI